MEFALSEEQEILMDSVKKMLDENISIDNLREHSKGDNSLRKCLRKLIVDMGLPGLMTVSYTHLTLPTILRV